MYMCIYVHGDDLTACIGNSRCSLGGGYMQVADTVYPSRLAVLTHPDLGACREGSSLRYICHVAYYHMYVCMMYQVHVHSRGICLLLVLLAKTPCILIPESRSGGQTWGEPSRRMHPGGRAKCFL